MSTITEKKPRTRGPERRDKYVALRLTPSEYAQLVKRKDRLKLTLTELLVRSALGELRDPSEVDKRVDLLEDRVERLERTADLGGLG